jgi:8-oxo-dGTP pyrophosphatase MutT (NUDIX family)
VTNKARLAAALKAIPPGTRGSIAPQSSGYGRISPVQSESYYNNPYQGSYGPFFPREPGVFSDGAFGPMPPIQPVPVDQPPDGSNFPDPRYWQPRPGWNLPTPPGSEGLKLASFDQLKVLSERYSVARACIDLRQEEIRGLSWQIGMTKDAAKHYQGSNSLMKDFGKRAAEATAFFRQPDPGYWNFDSFLNSLLEEILVYDSLCLVFRPKYGAKFGLGGRGLLGSNLDSIRLVSGPTIRPLIDMHGDTPLPPNPAYQQYLYGVPRSDYLTLMRGSDIDDYGLTGSQVGEYASDMMLYAPYWTRRESPYGFPPVERALLPIVSGLQKQEFQLDYFKEGSVPAIYISPGDPNITPTQIKELQDALNGIAGDPAYHLKVVVLPPGSKVEPQRAVDLSDGFDLLVQTQVCMAFDVQPIELGILPNIGGGSSQQSGPSGAAVRLGSMEARDIKSRKSTKPLLQFLSDIFNMVLQDICGQKDMQFQFEGLADDEDKQAITELGVEQVQNGIASIDEIRDRLDMPPWGLTETSEPVVFTAQGPIPFSMAPQLILAAQQGANGGNNSGSSKPKSNNRTQSTNSGQRSSNSGAPRTKQPAIRQGGQTKPNGSHPAPVSPHRESLTPAHSAASGAIQSSTPRTGGTTSRSSVAGSRKKAVEAEFGALKRHLRKGRLISTWEPEHIDERALSMIAEDVAKGVLIDVAVDRAAMFVSQDYIEGFVVEEPDVLGKADTQWPGWEHDLGLVGAYKHEIGEAFKTADVKAGDIRKDAAMGRMFVDNSTLRSLIAEEVHGTFLNVLEPLWTEAWDLGYEAAKSLATGGDPDFTVKYEGEALDNFVDTEGQHWLDQIARTGLKNADARAEVIARTEVARAMNAAAIQAYRDFGVTHKHLLIAPDDRCDICKDAEDEGVIPLDAIFPSGGLGGPFHPNCRCVPAPDGVDLEPPQAHIGKAEEDPSMVAFILYRSFSGDKEVFLLQKRGEDMNNPHTWGMPGGTSHSGETPAETAWRESQEEMGDLPVGMINGHFHERKNDRDIFVFLIDVPAPFTPLMNGSTPNETSGYGWFTRKEIKHLKLQPNFEEQWKNINWDAVGKHVSVTENGEMLTTKPQDDELYPAGARWPYPHRSDGAENPHYGTAETPEPPSRNPSQNTPAPSQPKDNMWDGPSSQVYETDETDEFPKRRTRNQGPKKNPSQEPAMPQNTDGGTNGGGESVGSRTGVPPGGKAAPVPAVGSVPARTPKPMSPRSTPPEVFDPAENVATEDENGNIAYYPVPQKKVKGTGGPSDYSDANPVDPEHVLNLMRSNFPEKALEWVRRARWVGPVNVPWERVDVQDIDKWASSHQPEAVNRFAKEIQAGSGHTNPSILIQDNDSPKAIIIDGHHRALARKKLGKPVLAYLGMIDPKDRLAAEETHSLQVHQGASPENR